MNILNYNTMCFNEVPEFDSIRMFTTKKDNIKTSEQIFNDTCMTYDINKENIASCVQIHSNIVSFVDKPGVYKNIDGLVTCMDNGITLKIQTADCVPIFMVDKINRLIGLVHSGWKGTKNSIILSALNIFINHGSDTKNIVVCIGPCIKECCYEVKEDVSKYFDKKNIVNRDSKIFLDLISKIKYDLYENGISKIFESDICTYHNEEYYSYRREQGSNARMYSMLGYKE